MQSSSLSRKMLALLTLFGVFAGLSFSSNFTIKKAEAAGLPAGYVETYTLKYSENVASSTSQWVYVAITHQSGGDLLYMERPEIGGNANCDDDGWTSSIATYTAPWTTTSNFAPAWTYNSTNLWCTTTAKYNLGKSLWVGEMTDGITVLQGNSGFNASTYGSPTSSMTTWTSNAQTVEVKLTAYYTKIDADSDGVEDSLDNCPSVYNPDQANSNGNTTGDVCESISVAASLNSNNPLTSIMYGGNTNSLLMMFDLKNNSSVTAPVTGMTFGLSGDFDWANKGAQISTLKLYDSAYSLLGSASVGPNSSGAQSASMTFSSPIQITGGSTQTYYLKADINSSQHTSDTKVYVQLQSLTSSNTYVTSSGLPLSNNFTISTSSSTTGSGTSTTTTTYPSSSCTNSTENGLTCSTCKDSSGAMSSKSCWQPSSSTTYSNTKSCDYYKSAEGLLCMSCNDTSGTLINSSCWKDSNYSSTSSCSGSDCFYSNNDRYTYGARCEYDSSKNWCEVCTMSGKEVRNTCTNAQTTTSTNTGTTSTTNNYYTNSCTSSTDSSGLKCSTCTDSSGKTTSKSCWVDYTTGTDGNYSSMPPTKSCDYYTESGMRCMSCKDTNGKTNSQSCWSETEYTSYGSGGYTDSFYSNNDRYTKGGHCDYPNASQSTTSTYSSGYNTSTWCEICSIAGKEVLNTCGTSSNPLNTKEVDTLSNYCEYVQDASTGTYCNICYGSAKQVTSKNCEDGGSGTISDSELSAQIKNMKESLKHREQDLLEFSRFTNRIDRKISDYRQRVSKTEKDFAWMVEEGADTSELDDIVDEMEVKIEELQKLKSEVAKEYSNFKSEIDIEKAAVAYFSSGSKKGYTWDQSDAAWLIIRRGDKFQALRDTFQGELSYFEMMDNYLEWSKERAVLMIRYELENIDVDDSDLEELQKGLDMISEVEAAYEEYLDQIDSFNEVLGNFPSQSTVDSLSNKEAREAFRSYFDETFSPAWSDLSYARETMQFYAQDISDLWDVLHRLYEVQANEYNKQYLVEEIAMIRDDIAIIEAAFTALNKKVSKGIQAKMDDVMGVLPQVTKMLDELEENMDYNENSNPFERLEKFGRYVDPKLMAVIGYLNENIDRLNLSPSEKAAVEKLREMDFSDDGGYGDERNPGFPDGCENCEGTLTGIYGSEMASQLAQMIKEEIMSELITQLSSALADSLSQYLDSETAGKVLKTVIANLDKLKGTAVGEELGNQILENNTGVLDEISAVDLSELQSDPEFKDEYNDLTDLAEDFQSIPVPDEEVATQISNYWSDVADIASDPTSEELDQIIADGEGLYKIAEESKYEYHLGFKDVPYVFDEEYDETRDWYSPYVCGGAMDGRWEGYKDSEGNPTYEFGPSDTTLRAEALKMVLSAYDEDEGSSEGGNYWWAGWEDTGDDMGLSIVDQDLAQPISRVEIARMIYEAGDMDAPDTFNGYFPDVTEADDWKPIEAMYEAGIFSGDGDTGNFRPYSNLNRAESAKVINMAAEWKDGEDFVDEDLYSYLPWTSKFMAKIAGAFKFMTNVFGI